MKKGLCVLFVVVHFLCRGQIAVIGHNMLNNSPLYQTRIIVKTAGVITKTMSTGSRADFKLELPFGNVYQVYFQNPIGPVMHMEVSGINVPADKYRYLMTYEMNVPFVNKQDEDVDTSVFVRPFYKILFNGVNRMVDDTAYNTAFEGTIIRKINPNTRLGMQQQQGTVILSGKLEASAGKNGVCDKELRLLNKNGQVLKTTQVNRFSSFAFTGVSQTDASKLQLVCRHPDSLKSVALLNNQRKPLSQGQMVNGAWEFDLNEECQVQMLDNNHTTNIGGKLVYSSPREKRFFAEKTVYLSNRMNTVVQKTKTNMLGTFVFEDIKPDHIYYIGIDRQDLGAGAKIDLLNKEDRYIATLDTVTAGRVSLKIKTNYNKVFNLLTIGENEMKMDIKATIFGDNVNNPIGKLKILLLNDNYEVIDSAMTDNFGTFKFRYLPFLKRFYLSAENTDNVLDVFKNILIYSSDDNLIKIMTHQKGTKFTYKPVSAELSRIREIELDDPLLEQMNKDETGDLAMPSMLPEPKKTPPQKGSKKLVVENILFEHNKSFITPQAKESLEKVIQVLQTNKNLRVEVGAHTDSKGSAEANLKLSEERARTVQQYILSKGIETQRVSAKGYGETVLLNHCDDAHNCSEAEHAQNRRIEFKILEGQVSK